MIDPTAPAPVDEPNALPAGTRFGELEILRTLGVGGFGIVYLARDHSLEREVAIKEYMPSQFALRHGQSHVSVRAASMQQTFELGLRSFVNEARLLARFDHPSLLKVYRFWEAHGTAYMAMPYLQGQNLREASTAQPTPPPEAWLRRVLLSVLDGLAVLHAQGVLHRDVAPDNIFLPADGGTPILLDFGAARQAIGDRTQSFTAILKPSFAPIEQYAEATGLRQGPWSDLYALAAVMHNLITGKSPAPAPARAMADDYQPLAAAGYAPSLLAALDWALRMPPHQRPQTAAAMRQVVEGLAEVPPPTAKPPPEPPPPAPAPPPEPVDIGFADTVQVPLDAEHLLPLPGMPPVPAQATPPAPRSSRPDRAARESARESARETARESARSAAEKRASRPAERASARSGAAQPASLSRKLQWAAIALALLLLGLFVSQLKRPAVAPATAAASAPELAAASQPAAALPDEAASAALAAASAPSLAPAASEPIEYYETPKPKPVVDPARPAKRQVAASRPEGLEGPPLPEPKPKPAPAPEPAPAPAPEPVPVEPKGPASPSEACAHRVFLARLWCIDRQCETAKFQGHEECVRLRERREARQGTGQP